MSTSALRHEQQRVGIWLPRAERKRIQQPRHRRQPCGEIRQTPCGEGQGRGDLLLIPSTL
jgi:hypothetical protein